jgi:hypothetical protein
MRAGVIATCVVVLGMVLGTAPASAELFKCRDANGGMAYSDKPCPQGTEDQAEPSVNSTPKSLGVSCWYDKDVKACARLKILSDGKPEVLAQARADFKYAQDRDSCLQGDYQACIRSICRDAFSDHASVTSILACAKEQKLPTGSNWAMVLPWKDAGAGVRTAQGFCLNASTFQHRDREVTSFSIITFRDDPNAPVRSRFEKRYSVSNNPGNTIDDAARGICKR